MTLEEYLAHKTYKTGYEHNLNRLNDDEQTRFKELFKKVDVRKKRFLSKRNLSEDEKDELKELMGRFRRFKP